MNNAPHKEEFPYWLVLVIGIGLYFAYRVVNDDLYVQVLNIVSKGISICVDSRLFFGVSSGWPNRGRTTRLQIWERPGEETGGVEEGHARGEREGV